MSPFHSIWRRTNTNILANCLLDNGSFSGSSHFIIAYNWLRYGSLYIPENIARLLR